jgi:flagellar hook-associated protein 3 FlgL
MNVISGNGTFATQVGAVNTGSGSVSVGTVIDPAAWVRDTYTIRMTSPTAYEVVDGANNPIATGSYVSGDGIEFRGVRVTVTGVPATGDTYSVAPSTRSDVFSMLDQVVANLESSTVTNADRARFASVAGASLAGLDRSIDQLLNTRAEVGGRLSAIDSANETRAVFELELQSESSALRDTDYAEAVTRLNQQYAGLQAAQAAYTRIAQLSLFDYL